jgi:hypothetical protein
LFLVQLGPAREAQLEAEVGALRTSNADLSAQLEAHSGTQEALEAMQAKVAQAAADNALLHEENGRLQGMNCSAPSKMEYAKIGACLIDMG